MFLKEALDVGWATFDAGVRHERVDHELQPSRFRTARNAANTKLQDRSYRLNSYSVGSRVELGPLFAAKVRYASSQRAPEINELYASNAHYSVMTQEEGNQNLKPERAKNLELTGLFHIGGFELSATAYRMKYENYLYLGHSGLQTANRLPLKYWKQTDTTVKGFEIDASQALDLGRYGTLNISAFADLVKNKADHPDPLRAHNDGSTCRTCRPTATAPTCNGSAKAERRSCRAPTTTRRSTSAATSARRSRWMRSTWLTCRSAANCRCAAATSPAWKCSSTAATCSMRKRVHTTRH